MKKSKSITVSGVGCCLVDLLYNNIDFNSKEIQPFLSLSPGDGGLVPGQLVFREEFSVFCRVSFDEVLNKITGNKSSDKINIGGPSIVSLIHAAQMLSGTNTEIRFYGRGGDDEMGKMIVSHLQKSNIVLKDYKLIEGPTPSTVVLSDPGFHNGQGERMFINSIGAAWNYTEADLGTDFFDADVVIFGGTALVPGIHDSLTSLLKKAKQKGCFTIVNTVFDFRNEKINPTSRWPLGESDKSYSLIDLLIADKKEAQRLSGEESEEKMISFFKQMNLSALIITNGSSDVLAYSDGELFEEQDLIRLPVSGKISDELKQNFAGDTTGCGDNFAGGILTSLVAQIREGDRKFDLIRACGMGIVSGGFACFYLGGTYIEDTPGEKREKILDYYQTYIKQIEDRLS